MLGKLLRYEMIAVGRIMVPLYGVLLALAVMVGLSMATEPGVGFFIVFLLIVVGAAVIITSTILVFQRFWKGIYGEEGYLTWSLPASASLQLWNKTLSAAIWSALSLVTLGISSLIIMLGFAGAEGISEAIRLAAIKNPGIMGNLAWIVLILLLSAVKFALEFYAAACIGHLGEGGENWRTGATFIGFMVAEELIQKFPGLDRFLTTNQDFTEVVPGLELTVPQLTGTTILELVFAVIYFLITWWILKYKLNLR